MNQKQKQPIRVALIGSRKLAEPDYAEAADLFYRAALMCADLGMVIRSGAALGADNIAEVAYADAIAQGRACNSQVEIYIPWPNFAPYAPLKHLHIIPNNPELIKQSEEMVWATHPAPHRLSQGAMKLHSRNMNQVFGLDLNTPIDLCICWTKGGEAVGGTATAIKLCHHHEIPVFNLGTPHLDEELEELDKFLDSLCID